MKKLIAVMALAMGLISWCLFQLMETGPIQRARPMIRWSRIQSQKEAAALIARYLYPVLKEQKVLYIGSSPIGKYKDFVEVFGTTLSLEGINILLKQRLSPDSFGRMVLNIQSWEVTEIPVSCQRGDERGCWLQQSQAQWVKKDRSQSPLWMEMWKVTPTHFELFFRSSGGQ